MDTPSENALPYVYRRRVQWGDADPALIAYTARFLDFAMDAVDSWFRDVVGVDWYAMNTRLGVGSPVVHLDLDFAAPLRPGDELWLAVTVARIGRSSLHLSLSGTLAGARPVYSGTLVLAFVDRESVRSIAVPPLIREPIERYARDCGQALATQ